MTATAPVMAAVPETARLPTASTSLLLLEELTATFPLAWTGPPASLEVTVSWKKSTALPALTATEPDADALTPTTYTSSVLDA